MKRILILLCCLAMLLLTGCGETDDLTEITVVLDWTPNTNHTGLYIADAEGYFEEEGLKVNIIQPGDNYALQLVAAGQAEFCYSFQDELTFARNEDIPVVSIGAVIQHNTSCFAAPQEKGITTIPDFSGKTYGGWGGLVEYALLDYLMEQEGLPPVEIIEIGSSDFFAAVESDIDFSWIFYGATGIEAELREMPLDIVWVKDIAPELDYYTPVIAAEESWLAENGDIASAFMKALARGYEYADSDPEGAADILLSACPELDEELTRASLQWLAGSFQAEAEQWGLQDPAIWEGFGNWLMDRELINSGFDASAAFTNEYL